MDLEVESIASSDDAQVLEPCATACTSDPYLLAEAEIDAADVNKHWEKHRVNPDAMPDSLRGRTVHAYVLEQVVAEPPPYLAIPPAFARAQLLSSI